VRELSAILWTAMTTATEAWLDATPEVMGQLDASPDTSFSDPNRLEEAAVREALEAAHGKIAVAARVLGLKNRWVLYRLMERFDIKAS
jgi:two-component system nitrogen regulation response regulator GlnG/two-component system response regulator HydG